MVANFSLVFCKNRWFLTRSCLTASNLALIMHSESGIPRDSRLSLGVVGHRGLLSSASYVNKIKSVHRGHQNAAKGDCRLTLRGFEHVTFASKRHYHIRLTRPYRLEELHIILHQLLWLRTINTEEKRNSAAVVYLLLYCMQLAVHEYLPWVQKEFGTRLSSLPWLCLGQTPINFFVHRTI